MKSERWPLLPFAVIVLGIAVALACGIGYTTWAIGQHSRQACAELRILAGTGGATTRYDRSVRAAYQRLYALRCA